MELPLVSVITPSYNQGRFIEQTIQSVLEQDYPNIEYLVIDGGSTDNTLAIIRKYENKLKWVSEPDRGQTDAINKGFRKAQGEILCWLNSDDTYEPGAISRAVECFLEHPDVMMVYGEGNEIDEHGALIQRFPATQRFDLWKLIHVWDYILQPTTFFRKDIFHEIALPDISLNWCMDWDLWIRIGCRFKVACINYVFANSRVYSETKTGSGGLKRLREINSILRKYGRRKYPPGFFIYGQDTLESTIKARLSLLYRLILKYPLSSLRLFFSKMIYESQGVFQDNWVSRRACFTVPVQGGDTLIIEGMVPSRNDMLQLRIDMKINRKEKNTLVVEKQGNFRIEHKLSASHSKEDLIDIIIRSDKAGTDNDKRQTSFLLKDMYVTKT